MRVSGELFKMMRGRRRGVVWARMSEGEGRQGRAARVSGLQHSGITRQKGRRRGSLLLLTRPALTCPLALPSPAPPHAPKWSSAVVMGALGTPVPLQHYPSPSPPLPYLPAPSVSRIIPRCVLHFLDHSKIIYLPLLRFVSVTYTFCCYSIPGNASLRNLSAPPAAWRSTGDRRQSPCRCR